MRRRPPLSGPLAHESAVAVETRGVLSSRFSRAHAARVSRFMWREAMSQSTDMFVWSTLKVCTLPE